MQEDMTAGLSPTASKLDPYQKRHNGRKHVRSICFLHSETQVLSLCDWYGARTPGWLEGREAFGASE